MTTIERIMELQEERGLNAKTLETEAGLTNGSITSWKKAKYAPGTEAITKLAKYFGVTTDYLLCLSDTRTPKVGISLSDHEQLLIKAFRSADAEGQQNIIFACQYELRKTGKGEVVSAG